MGDLMCFFIPHSHKKQKNAVHYLAQSYPMETQWELQH